MSGTTTSIGEMVARIGIASARYELYERLAHKALQKCTPEQVLALLKELKIEQYERNMLKMSDKLSNKTCGECKHFQVICDSVTRSTNAAGCDLFEKKIATNGDKIIQKGNKGIAAFACGLLNDRSEETFQRVLNILNAPAESEGK